MTTYLPVQPDRLYRVERSGHATVHLPTCRHLARASNGAPWNWAEGRTLAEVFWAPWNQPCLTCFKPFATEGHHRVVNGRVQP